MYGKIMESLRNRINIKLVNNEKDYLKCSSKPSCMSHKIFDNNLVAISRVKLALKINKAAYIGMCILELSKVLMYKFHCDYIKIKYDNYLNLIFTGTDSLMYEFKTEDVYKDFSSAEEIFDISNYSTKSKYYHSSNKLMVGKMKNKTAGVAMKYLLD